MFMEVICMIKVTAAMQQLWCAHGGQGYARHRYMCESMFLCGRNLEEMRRCFSTRHQRATRGGALTWRSGRPTFLSSRATHSHSLSLSNAALCGT